MRGEAGSLHVPAAFLPGTEEAEFSSQTSSGEETHRTEGADEYRLMVEHFADCVLHDKPLRYDATEATANMRVIDALYASARAGPEASEAFFDFFVATIRNGNTRKAYARAVWKFLAWCEGHGLTLREIRPAVVSAYIEELSLEKSKPTVKQTLAAIKGLFDFLVVRQVVPFNPASSVKGPSYGCVKLFGMQ